MVTNFSFHFSGVKRKINGVAPAKQTLIHSACLTGVRFLYLHLQDMLMISFLNKFNMTFKRFQMVYSILQEHEFFHDFRLKETQYFSSPLHWRQKGGEIKTAEDRRKRKLVKEHTNFHGLLLLDQMYLMYLLHN